MELNQDLVEEGKALVVKTESAERMTCEARFDLGRWAEKVAPMTSNGGDRSTSPMGGMNILVEYAEAIGISHRTLQAYRDVAVAWDGDDPSGLSWTVARKLAYRTDRAALVNAVFQMFGKVTPKTIDDYESHIREENKRREALLTQTVEEPEEADDWSDEESVEFDEEETHASTSTTNTSTTRKHGFSRPIRKLFAVVEHARDARNMFLEEHIPTDDVRNDEYFDEIMTAFDYLITEMMAYREDVVKVRSDLGLSIEITK